MTRPRCPRCDSPDPARHPAMQFEGEVQICPHEFHGFPPPDPNDRQVWRVETATDTYWAYREESDFVFYSWGEGQALSDWFFDRRSRR